MGLKKIKLIYFIFYTIFILFSGFHSHCTNIDTLHKEELNNHNFSVTEDLFLDKDLKCRIANFNSSLILSLFSDNYNIFYNKNSIHHLYSAIVIVSFSSSSNHLRAPPLG